MIQVEQEYSDFIKLMLSLSNQRRKVSLSKVLKAFAEIYPQDYYGEGNQMRNLMRVLKNLASQNSIKLPVGKIHWDDSYTPSAPRWIKIIKLKPQKERTPWKKFPWHPQMTWASELKNIQESSFESLRQLDHFFVNLGGNSMGLMTIKERSLQIFKDEKKLDSLITRPWFQEHISLKDLGCYKTIEPFASKTFPNAKTNKTIIIENRDTFDSFCKANGRVSTPFYKYIIYGCGDRIEGQILWISGFDQEIRTIEYFGDLDLNGLAIPYRVNQVLIDNDYVQRIELAKVFYTRLIKLARKYFPQIDSNIALKSDYKLLNFLSPDEKRFVGLVLQQGKRIAQELLNYEEISKIFMNYTKTL